MGIGDKLKNEVMAWGSLAIVIVIISVVLLKFKTSNAGGLACTLPYGYLNTTSNLCCGNLSAITPTAVTGNCTAGNTTALNSVGGTLDTFISALSEPKNWVAIVIIAIIGFAILYLFTKKKQ